MDYYIEFCQIKLKQFLYERKYKSKKEQDWADICDVLLTRCITN